MTNHDIIWKKIANELEIPKELVERICRSEFEFVQVTMEKSEPFIEKPKTIRLQHFGTFYCHPTRWSKVIEKRKSRAASE